MSTFQDLGDVSTNSYFSKQYLENWRQSRNGLAQAENCPSWAEIQAHQSGSRKHKILNILLSEGRMAVETTSKYITFIYHCITSKAIHALLCSLMCSSKCLPCY